MPSVKIIYSNKCLKYKDSGHPEAPHRIETTARYLKDKGYKFDKPKPADEKDILAVHSKDLLAKVKSGNFFEASTPNLENIFKYALLSAGAAIKAASICEKGGISLSLMRPPGHHAERNRLGGFCYFNNLAVAVSQVLGRNKKVAIIDFDCHHGQGTENIFIGKENVIVCSLHQSGIYPNTGLSSEANSYNFPLLELTGDEEYLRVFAKALDIIRDFEPDVVAVSAGFDAYANDPITNMDLSLGTYKRIGELISGLAKPTFSVLEGGYSDDLYQCVEAYLVGLESR